MNKKLYRYENKIYELRELVAIATHKEIDIMQSARGKETVAYHIVMPSTSCFSVSEMSFKSAKLEDKTTDYAKVFIMRRKIEKKRNSLQFNKKIEWSRFYHENIKPFVPSNAGDYTALLPLVQKEYDFLQTL